jgi:hypothetical protein
VSDTTEQPGPRRAKIHLSLLKLERFIDLPEGLRLSHLYASHDPGGVILVVEGDALDETDPGRELPWLDPTAAAIHQVVQYLDLQDGGPVFERRAAIRTPQAEAMAASTEASVAAYLQKIGGTA